MIPITRVRLSEETVARVVEVLRSGQLAEGDEVRAFEKEFASCFSSPHAVATNNGTTALHVALLAAGVQPGDLVITTPFSFVATANAILYCGATPVFVDIDPETYNISPDSILKALRRYPESKFLLVVHLYGNPCDMDRIMELAETYSLTVVEDCAQAHLAKWSGRIVGTFGKAAAFSFYPTKNMTTGEGGMVLTSDPDVYERAYLFSHHGTRERYEHLSIGYNYRMTNIAAAIGRAQLEGLEQSTQIRQRNAWFLTRHLENLPIVLPRVLPPAEHVFHQYTVSVSNREMFCRHLRRCGVGFGIYYPKLLPEYPHLRASCICLELDNAERVKRQVVSLPVHPLLNEEELEHIVDVVHSFFQ